MLVHYTPTQFYFAHANALFRRSTTVLLSALCQRELIVIYPPPHTSANATPFQQIYYNADVSPLHSHSLYFPHANTVFRRYTTAPPSALCQRELIAIYPLPDTSANAIFFYGYIRILPMSVHYTPTKFYFAHANTVFRRLTTVLYSSPHSANVSRLPPIRHSFTSHWHLLM
jgi:hypothetical protein